MLTKGVSIYHFSSATISSNQIPMFGKTTYTIAISRGKTLRQKEERCSQLRKATVSLLGNTVSSLPYQK